MCLKESDIEGRFASKSELNEQIFKLSIQVKPSSSGEEVSSVALDALDRKLSNSIADLSDRMATFVTKKDHDGYQRNIDSIITSLKS